MTPLTEHERSFVEAHLPLVERVARRPRMRRMAGNYRCRDDAVQQITLGLVYAARHFDPAKGRIESYLDFWAWKFLCAGAREEIMLGCTVEADGAPPVDATAWPGRRPHDDAPEPVDPARGCERSLRDGLYLVGDGYSVLEASRLTGVGRMRLWRAVHKLRREGRKGAVT